MFIYVLILVDARYIFWWFGTSSVTFCLHYSLSLICCVAANNVPYMSGMQQDVQQ